MKKTILSFILFLLPFYLFSESPIEITAPQIVPVSPEAAAVERYASYPVNHSTGVPSITIPLYEIKVGDLTLPITLSYHSSGVKPKEHSGWAGTGWTLSAEPSIMRNIQGIADDHQQNAGSPGEPYGGYFYPYGNDAFMEEKRQQENSSVEEKRYLRHYSQEIDGEPDIYSYKLPHASGTAIPNKYMTFYSFPLDNIHIQASANMHSIDVYDETGVRYIMGAPVVNSQYDYHELSGDQQYITRWLCSRIESRKTGARINFSYSDVTYLPNINRLNDYITIEDMHGGGYPCSYPPTLIQKIGPNVRSYSISDFGELLQFDNSYDYLNTRYTVSDHSKTGDNSVYGKLLKDIYFDNGSVEFKKDVAGNLSKMLIKDKEGNLIRWVDFYITKYNQNTELTKLDSIKISALNCQSRVYKFRYHSSENVHPRSTRAIDHWGYANKISYQMANGESTVPKLGQMYVHSCKFAEVERKFNLYILTNWGDTIYPGGNRDSNLEAAKLGVLAEIINPEGAQTIFYYDINKTFCHLSDYAPESALGILNVGGLRIQKIEEKDNDGNTYIRQFYYYYHRNGIDSINVGIPKRYPVPADYCLTQEKVEMVNFGGGYSRYRVRTWVSSSYADIAYNNGSPILYNKVKERKFKFGETNNTMSSIYYYTSPKEALSIGYSSYGALEHWYLPERSKDMPFFVNNEEYSIDGDLRRYQFFEDDNRLGMLKKVEHYDKDMRLVSETNYIYGERKTKNYGEMISSWNAVKVYQSQLFTNLTITPKPADVPGDIYHEVKWKNVAPFYPLLEDSVITYYDTNSVAEKREYRYNANIDHTYPVQITTTNSHGKEEVEQFVYAYDQERDSIDSDIAFWDLMDSRMAGALVKYRKTTGNSTSFLLNRYDGIRKIGVDSKFSLNDSYLNNYMCSKYNDYGNPVEMFDNTGLYTCFIWGYNFQYPIAKIEGMNYETLLSKLNKNAAWIKTLEQKNEPSAADFTLISNLRNDNTLVNVNIYTYTYKPLIGVTSITDQRGFTTYHKYDYFGRLTEAYIYKDGVKNVIQQNAYNLAGAAVNQPGADMYPLMAEFSDDNRGAVLEGNVDICVSVFGGSSNFEYNWSLWERAVNSDDFVESKINGMHQTKKTTTPCVQINKTTVGLSSPVKILQLRCKIKDKTTSEENEVVTWFYSTYKKSF